MADSPALELTDRAIADLAEGLLRRAAGLPHRLILGIAGVPGAGKSTLARRVAGHVHQHTPGAAALAPLDGFHLSQDQLERRGLLERKGAPETFDARAYIQMVRRARHPHRTLHCPAYDRRLHEPAFDDDPLHRVTRQTRIVIAEGNYLLIRRHPWLGLEQALTRTWWIDIPLKRAQQQLMQRHLKVGRTSNQAAHRCEFDMENARFVLDESGHADRVMRWPE